MDTGSGLVLPLVPARKSDINDSIKFKNKTFITLVWKHIWCPVS